MLNSVKAYGRQSFELKDLRVWIALSGLPNIRSSVLRQGLNLLTLIVDMILRGLAATPRPLVRQVLARCFRM